MKDSKHLQQLRLQQLLRRHRRWPVLAYIASNATTTASVLCPPCPRIARSGYPSALAPPATNNLAINNFKDVIPLLIGFSSALSYHPRLRIRSSFSDPMRERKVAILSTKSRASSRIRTSGCTCLRPGTAYANRAVAAWAH